MTQVKMFQNLNVFKVAYKVVRDTSEEIYKAFGFKHLLDATQYYVHPDNQSYSGTTTLCQPIGEALVLFTAMLKACAAGRPIGDYYVNSERGMIFLEIDVPEEYRLNGVVEPRIYKYCAALTGNQVSICAYGGDSRCVHGSMEHLRPLYKLLPVFMVLLVAARREKAYSLVFAARATFPHALLRIAAAYVGEQTDFLLGMPIGMAVQTAEAADR